MSECKNGITPEIISVMEGMIRNNERIAVIERLLEKNDYISITDLRAVLGIERKEKTE